ncbi:MAG: hypothetical protein LBG79_03350, partial [Spirochaetaceae bacterium]|nr:hypothetical protein [Spirochaetaceae bacterium]
MKSAKIIFAVFSAFLTLAACRAGKLDVEGGKPEVPKKGDMVAVSFNPNGAYWINQNNLSDKSDTGVKPSSQTIGRFVVLPPEPIFEWDIANGQRSDTKYEFVSWYQPAAGQPPLEPLLADENASDELKERFVNGGTIVNGNIKGAKLYALWREPPSTQQIRITFKKFFDVTAQEELAVLVLPAVNTGVAAQDLPQNVSREHYTDAEPGKWYEVSNGAVDYTADFDLSAAITGSHTLVKK